MKNKHLSWKYTIIVCLILGAWWANARLGVKVNSYNHSISVSTLLADADETGEPDDNKKWDEEYPECDGSTTTTVTTTTTVGIPPNTVTTSSTHTEVTKWKGTYRDCVEGSGLCAWNDNDCVQHR